MPSYLSSTQTVGPRRPMISAASSAGDASMNLSGWNSPSAASPRRPSRASVAVRPTSPVSIPARLTSSSGRSNAFAIAASSRPSRRPIRSSPLSTLTIPVTVRGEERAMQRLQDRRLRRRARGRLDRLERRRDLREGGLDGRVGRVTGLLEHLPHRRRHVGGAVVGAAHRVGVRAGDPEDGAAEARPAHADRALVGLGERAAGQEHGRDRQLLGREAGEVLAEDRGLLGGLRRRRDALRGLGPAAHVPDGIGFR